MSEESEVRSYHDASGRPAGEQPQPEESEPTPGSDGDGAESGYTSPAELAAQHKTSPKLGRESHDGP